ncbi:MAG: O-methyltransferase [Acholeplasmataceae bacterium]
MIGLKSYAKENNIPIISDDGLLFLLDLLNISKIETMLEIGTAIGYTAIVFAKKGVFVDTIERDSKMIRLAKEHFILYNVLDKVTLYEKDALELDLGDKMYDLIFIDAAKAQYQRFFEKYSKHLKPNGLIVCDNLDFHHLKPEMVSRHTRQLLRKIHAFKSYLASHPTFDTTVYQIGDGMSVSKRKAE